MPDQDIFENGNTNNNPAGEVTDPPAGEKTDDKSADLLNAIVNEDGTPKYNSVDDFVKGAVNAQDHIKNLESELAQLRDKANTGDKLDDLLDAVKSKGSGQGEEASTMKPEDVLGIVKDYLSDTRAAETRQSNIDSVAKVFRDRYGKDASETMYGKADDLGLGRDEINKLIANNPKAALKILGENEAKKKSADPVGMAGQGTAGFQGQRPVQKKSIMQMQTSKELADSWEASKQKTLERLGLAD